MGKTFSCPSKFIGPMTDMEKQRQKTEKLKSKERKQSLIAKMQEMKNHAH